MHAHPRPIARPGVTARRPHPKKKQRWMPWLIVGGMLAAGMMMILGVIGILAVIAHSSEEPNPSEFLPSVTVAGVSLGGQTVTDATHALQQQNLAHQPILVTDGDRHWTVTLAELGVNVDIAATIQMARVAAPGSVLQPQYTVDLNQTQVGLFNLSQYVNIAAVPGDPPQIGRVIEIPVMLNRLYEDLSGELGDGVLELAMVEIEPPELEPVVQYTGVTTTHVVGQGQELALIARYYGVTMDDIVNLNQLADPNLIYPGQELLIPAAGMYSPSAARAPAAPTTVGKAIVVSTGDQRIYAYENGQLIRSHLTSTGLPDTPTVLGDYKIYRKYVAKDMRGPDYFLPQVPYTMFFYQGYGIHGTYWHNSFGRPMSHGCVNLPTAEAEWFFNWAEVGTPVRVI